MVRYTIHATRIFTRYANARRRDIPSSPRANKTSTARLGVLWQRGRKNPAVAGLCARTRLRPNRDRHYEDDIATARPVARSCDRAGVQTLEFGFVAGAADRAGVGVSHQQTEQECKSYSQGNAHTIAAPLCQIRYDPFDRFRIVSLTPIGESVARISDRCETVLGSPACLARDRRFRRRKASRVRLFVLTRCTAIHATASDPSKAMP